MEEEEEHQLLSSLPPKSDICQVLMDRFAKSPASQHRHLIASAAAMKSILQEENLPLTPLSYFAATISAINDAATESLDSDSVSISSLSSFLSILLPLIPAGSISPGKAADAVDVLVLLLRKEEGVVSTATVRGVVKCLGELTVLCDLEDWSKVRVPFETVSRFLVDKRPKVRKCAQVCVEKVFKAFPSSVVKEASKVVHSLFNNCMAHAIQLNNSKVVHGSKREMLSKPEHLEVVHLLNSLKFIVPYLSKRVGQKILSDLSKLLTCQFSPLTRHLFDILEAFSESSGADVIVPVAENISNSLASFVCSYEKNPTDTVISASNLLKSYMDKLHREEPIICTRKLSIVFGSIAGLLVVDTYSSQAAGILKEMTNVLIDGDTFLGSEFEVDNEKLMAKEESSAIKSVCALFENILCNCDGIPNEHTLAVIATMFFKLGAVSYIFMKDILVKLAGLIIILEGRDVTEKKHLQECIGSAVIAIGPEKILTLIPVSFDSEKQLCSNTWLLPILNKYVTGASLEYFLKHMVPLVESLQQVRRKVKKSPIRQHLQASIHGIWGLLPAFCRYPTDTHKCFEPLAKILTAFLKDYSYMHEDIALALQELVNQNRSILVSAESAAKPVEPPSTYSIDDFGRETRCVPPNYSAEVAARNIQALSSCSMDLLQALTDVFFDTPPKNRTHLKKAIGCLASVTESSRVKQLFISTLEKFKVTNVEAESDKLENDDCASVLKRFSEDAKKDELEKAKKRGMVMEFAHSLIAGAQVDLLDTVFNFIKASLQVSSEIGQSEAYCTLSRIFEEHTWFYSSRFDEMVDLLLGIKAPVDIATLRSRFSCLQNLLVYILKSDLNDGNSKAFLILNEIVLALKDANEELRKEAYDVLLKISDRLNLSSSDSTDYQQLFSMIMGYLSGSPPPIVSAAVAALSLLIYKNSGVCFSVPELVPSVFILLQSKANEVIKAVLGFVKVLVSSVQASDLQKFLPDIVNGTLPWSSVSKNHFRSKVVTIFEIMIRKCGYAAVESLVPGRYKGFIKTVKEQRHGRTSSKEAEPSDTAVPYIKRDNKRSRAVTEGEGTDLVTAQFDRVNKKHRYHIPKKSNGFGKGDRRVDNGKSPKPGRSERRAGGSRKPFENKERNKRPYAGGQKNMRQREKIKTRQTPYDKSGSGSKFHRRRKTDE